MFCPGNDQDSHHPEINSRNSDNDGFCTLSHFYDTWFPPLRIAPPYEATIDGIGNAFAA